MNKTPISTKDIFNSLMNEFNSLDFSVLQEYASETSERELLSLINELLKKLRDSLDLKTNQFQNITKNTEEFLVLLFTYYFNVKEYIVSIKIIETCRNVIDKINASLRKIYLLNQEINKIIDGCDNRILNYKNETSLEKYSKVALANGLTIDSFDRLKDKFKENKTIKQIIDSLSYSNCEKVEKIDENIHLINSLNIIKKSLFISKKEYNQIKHKYSRIKQDAYIKKEDFKEKKDNALDKLVDWLKTTTTPTRMVIYGMLGIMSEDNNYGYYTIYKHIKTIQKEFFDLW